MWSIDNASSVGARPAVPASAAQGYFIDTGDGTILPAWWLNMMQDEAQAILAAANVAPSKTTFNQLLQSILLLILSSTYEDDASATANAVQIAPSPAITALSEGMAWRVKVAVTNTGAATLQVNALGAVAIQFRGAALGAGALQAGKVAEFVYDGAHLQLISPPGPSAWVGNADLAKMATGTVKANLIGGTAAPADVTLASLAAAMGALLIGAAAGGDLSGTFPNPTIAEGAVSNDKLAEMATSTVKANVTGATAEPTDVTLAAFATAMGALLSGAAAGGDLAGTFPNPTIGLNKATNAKLAQAAAHTLKGNFTNAAANVSDGTVDAVIAMLGLIGDGAGYFELPFDNSGTLQTLVVEMGTFGAMSPGANTTFNLTHSMTTALRLFPTTRGSGAAGDNCVAQLVTFTAGAPPTAQIKLQNVASAGTNPQTVDYIAFGIK